MCTSEDNEFNLIGVSISAEAASANVGGTTAMNFTFDSARGRFDLSITEAGDYDFTDSDSGTIATPKTGASATAILGRGIESYQGESTLLTADVTTPATLIMGPSANAYLDSQTGEPNAIEVGIGIGTPGFARYDV
jgi:hypothetical protein